MARDQNIPQAMARDWRRHAPAKIDRICWSGCCGRRCSDGSPATRMRTAPSGCAAIRRCVGYQPDEALRDPCWKLVMPAGAARCEGRRQQRCASKQVEQHVSVLRCSLLAVSTAFCAVHCKITVAKDAQKSDPGPRNPRNVGIRDLAFGPVR
jgi:hypothetical protein